MNINKINLNRDLQEAEKIKNYDDKDIKEGDLVMCRGKICRMVKRDTGYTIRSYYSHETIEDGPGPGWDYRWDVLKKYGVDNPSELPNEPYYILEPEEIADKKIE